MWIVSNISFDIRSLHDVRLLAACLPGEAAAVLFFTFKETPNANVWLHLVKTGKTNRQLPPRLSTVTPVSNEGPIWNWLSSCVLCSALKMNCPVSGKSRSSWIRHYIFMRLKFYICRTLCYIIILKLHSRPHYNTKAFSV